MQIKTYLNTVFYATIKKNWNGDLKKMISMMTFTEIIKKK